MESSISYWFRKVFVRDVDLSKRGFFYFFIGFSHWIFILDFILSHFISFNTDEMFSLVNIVAIIVFILTFALAGFLVDKIKRRMRFLVILSSLISLSAVLLFYDELVYTIFPISSLLFASGIYLIDLLTVFTHETTILNRGRLLSYLLIISFIISHLLIVLINLDIMAFVIINITFLAIEFAISRVYSYVETEERLTSDHSFKEILLEKSHLGYLLAFLSLGYTIGNAFEFNAPLFTNPFFFFSLLLVAVGITGIFLDNMGRKWSFSAAILIISILIIFSGILRPIFSTIFLPLALPIALILLFAFTGDFSTERNTLKYRGAISSIFLFCAISGFLGGIFIKIIALQTFLAHPDLWWIPELTKAINTLLLIIILVWIMPLPEILSSKESIWADALRNLYVFNRNSLCIYSKTFDSRNQSALSEDLITGGLSGILKLISEITNERKNLRIIDKDQVKLYFEYGRYTVLALTADRYLPILFKKMEIFLKRFEHEFEKELENFHGETSQFSSKTELLVNRYFK
ncbi:MAG: conserved membrane protein of unknown function [Promethearchaeota archaeon]|nr:MAG: conserved membrane protein of unknown function [Candidatus Lokiarchaeota archaeon]